MTFHVSKNDNDHLNRTVSMSRRGEEDDGEKEENPDPETYNAAEEEGPIRDVIIHAAAAQQPPTTITVPFTSAANAQCLRLETLLSRVSSVAAPLYLPRISNEDDGHNGGEGGVGTHTTRMHSGRLRLGERGNFHMYSEALARSGVVLLAAVAMGLAATLGFLALRRGRGGLSAAAVTARFPATTLQCLVFLSPGAAVACGLSLADDVAPAAVGIAVLVAAPLCWAAAVGWGASSTSGGLFVEVASALERSDGKGYGESADDDPIDNAVLAGATAAGGCLGGRALLCGAVRPSSLAAPLGPVLGDLGGCYPFTNSDQRDLDKNNTYNKASTVVGPSGAALRSLLPAALPWALLIAALVVRSTASCEHMPLVACALVALYAAFVAAVRPFTGHSHNAFEALWSVVAAGLLLWLWLALGSGWEPFSLSERAAATCLGGLLSCRYPFVLARALGVGVPRVVAIVAPEEGGSRPSVPILAVPSRRPAQEEADEAVAAVSVCLPNRSAVATPVSVSGRRLVPAIVGSVSSGEGVHVDGSPMGSFAAAPVVGPPVTEGIRSTSVPRAASSSASSLSDTTAASAEPMIALPPLPRLPRQSPDEEPSSGMTDAPGSGRQAPGSEELSLPAQCMDANSDGDVSTDSSDDGLGRSGAYSSASSDTHRQEDELEEE